MLKKTLAHHTPVLLLLLGLGAEVTEQFHTSLGYYPGTLTVLLLCDSAVKGLPHRIPRRHFCLQDQKTTKLGILKSQSS